MNSDSHLISFVESPLYDTVPEEPFIPTSDTTLQELIPEMLANLPISILPQNISAETIDSTPNSTSDPIPLNMGAATSIIPSIPTTPSELL